jgi:hypothetical protein
VNLTSILASLTSWKTTAAGVAVAAAAVAKFATDLSAGTFDPSTLYTDFIAITTAVGLLFAKDANVTNAAPSVQVPSAAVKK